MSQKYTGIVRLKKDTNIESTERRDFCRFGGLERRGRYGHRRFSAVFQVLQYTHLESKHWGILMCFFLFNAVCAWGGVPIFSSLTQHRLWQLDYISTKDSTDNLTSNGCGQTLFQFGCFKKNSGFLLSSLCVLIMVEKNTACSMCHFEICKLMCCIKYR